MPNIIEVTDLSLPALDVFARLTQPQLRSRLEPEKRYFYRREPQGDPARVGRRVRANFALMERRQIEGSKPASCPLRRRTLIAADRDLLAPYRLPADPRCAVCHAASLPAHCEGLCARGTPGQVLESIVDAANLGAIFRSAAALGVDAVLTPHPPACDPLCRRAVRVSRARSFRSPGPASAPSLPEWPQPRASRTSKKWASRPPPWPSAMTALSIEGTPAHEGRKARDRAAGTEGDGLAPHNRRLRLHGPHPHDP